MISQGISSKLPSKSNALQKFTKGKLIRERVKFRYTIYILTLYYNNICDTRESIRETHVYDTRFTRIISNELVAAVASFVDN